MPTDVKSFKLEDAQIIFKNFSGKENSYNPFGHPNFSVILDLNTARELKKEGWNVRTFSVDGEDKEYITIWIMNDALITIRNSKTAHLVDDLDTLDKIEFKKTELVVRGFEWEIKEKYGIKAFCKSLIIIK